jgi:DNA repair exonuclease SbcCD ATPase subunit
MAAAKSRMRLMNNSQDEVRDQLEGAVEAYESGKAQLQEKLATQQALETQMSEHAERVEGLTEQLEVRSKEHAGLQKSIDASAARLSELKKKQKEILRQERDLKDKREKSAKMRGPHEAEIQRLLAKHMILEQELEQANGAYETFTKQVLTYEDPETTLLEGMETLSEKEARQAELEAEMELNIHSNHEFLAEQGNLKAFLSEMETHLNETIAISDKFDLTLREQNSVVHRNMHKRRREGVTRQEAVEKEIKKLLIVKERLHNAIAILEKQQQQLWHQKVDIATEVSSLNVH